MTNTKRFSKRTGAACGLLLSALLLAAPSCGGNDDDGKAWQLVAQSQPGALISIWGTSSSDVWTVGGDARDGTGPLVLHYDGTSWERLETGETQGNLWWLHGFENGPVYMGGDGGVILRYENGTFTKMTTPGTGTIYGVWGANPDDVWAVGNVTATTGGFAWKLDGDTWVDEPTLSADIEASGALWKVSGCAANDAFLVGADGVALHWDGTSLAQIETGTSTSLFNVHCNDERTVAVGGLASGVIIEFDGTSWVNVTPEAAAGLTGVFLNPDDTGYAVGQYGAVYERVDGIWRDAEVSFYVDQGLHATWVDPDGGMWAVGGQTAGIPLTDGMIIHYGADVATTGL